MKKSQLYSLDLNGASPEEIRELLEKNESIFENSVLSVYGDDMRYSFVRGSLRINIISENFAEYRCDVNFFAGCSDQNETFSVTWNFKYKIEDEHIVIELDESEWNQE
ncbi:hypothetical protein ABW286_03880 [Erwinia papayae]|uniref:Uncharacterized protein n=1 Tax=Erwinia papayae TaxID=206499 RepID=A0ABV3MXN2_9GAMM